MILGIDTSTKTASLALWDETTGELVADRRFTSDRAHNSVIFGSVEELLEIGRSELRGIVVGLGPGNYSGVRVGIAVANGLSMSMGMPAVGRSSLEAWECENESYVVVGDARRRSFFVAQMESRQLQAEPDLVEEAELVMRLEGAVESGLPVYTPDQSVQDRFPGAVLSGPSATQLVRLQSAKDPEEWETGSPLEPHYLRAPYITVPKTRGPA